jgi:hypothetical protein
MIAATMSRNFVRFPLKTQHNRPRNLRLPVSPERENRLTWKPNGLRQMRLPNT